MRKLWLGILIAALIVIGIILVHALTNKKATTTSPAVPPQTTSNSSQQQAPAGKPAAQNAVTISNFAFHPATITVKAGTTVTWTNKDSTAHTVTADTPSADAPASGDINQGASYSFTFKKAGTYAYHCTMHPYMKGTVVVTE